MKQTLTIIVLAILVASSAGAIEAPRPSITFDYDFGLNNSDYAQADAIGRPYQVDFNYKRAGMLLELPASNDFIVRFGLEMIRQGFDPTNLDSQNAVFSTGTSFATYNVRLGFKFYLDGK